MKSYAKLWGNFKVSEFLTLFGLRECFYANVIVCYERNIIIMCHTVLCKNVRSY